MKEPLHEIFTWFAFATASIAPGIVGAAFGRGPWMVLAAIFSVLAFFGTTPLGIWYFAWTGASYWKSFAIPIGIATACACFAIIEERRKRLND
jgi:hypothetical protein